MVNLFRKKAKKSKPDDFAVANVSIHAVQPHDEAHGAWLSSQHGGCLKESNLSSKANQHVHFSKLNLDTQAQSAGAEVSELKQQVLALQAQIAQFESTDAAEIRQGVNFGCKGLSLRDTSVTTISSCSPRSQMSKLPLWTGGCDDSTQASLMHSLRSTGYDTTEPNKMSEPGTGTEDNPLKGFLDTVSSAVSVSIFQQDDLEKKAFKYFSLLSIDENLDGPLDDDIFLQGRSRFLDPFHFQDIDVLDVYPKPAKDKDDAPLFDFKKLSSFCVPYGVRVRLVPKVALRQANEMGWVGKSVDRYQGLAFTDASGETRSGVAICCKTEVHCDKLTSELTRLRGRRRAAVLIVRWWKQISVKLAEERQQAVLERDNSETEDVRSDALSWAEKSWLSVRELSAYFAPFSAWLEGNMLSTTIRDRSVKKNSEVASILYEFIDSSLLPSYNEKTRKGIWVSGKVKKSIYNQDLYVVVKIAPLETQKELDDKLPFDLEEKVKAERWRLVVMLSDVRIRCEVLGSSRDIKEVVFTECDKILDSIKDDETTVSESPIRNNPSFTCQPIPSPSTRTHAREAYQEMIDAEKEGDVCIVEKCYVLMGVQHKEQCLILAALHQLVDFERENEEKRMRSSKKHKISHATKLEEILFHRHTMLAFIQDNALLTPKHSCISFPDCEREHVSTKRERFELKLPITDAPPISLPLPLPEITSTWALGMMLLRIGSKSLMTILNALLRERPLLIIGRSPGEVSACAMTLRELLKPYNWPSIFLPLLPVSLLDFILSPVPFIVGVAVETTEEIADIRADERTEEALLYGMSLLDLTTGSLTASIHFEDEDQLLPMLSPGISDAIQCLERRLQELGDENPKSCLRNLKSYDPRDTFKSFQYFVQHGLTAHESLSLHKTRTIIKDYMLSLGGDLHADTSSWCKYGHFDESDKFFYDPNLFLEPLRARLRFMEEMATSQMFSVSVDSYRNAEQEAENQRKIAGRRIVLWMKKKLEEWEPCSI